MATIDTSFMGNYVAQTTTTAAKHGGDRKIVFPAGWQSHNRPDGQTTISPNKGLLEQNAEICALAVVHAEELYRYGARLRAWQQ